jgi:hypothetical protein
MFHMVNNNTLVHALFCIWLHEMYPCKDDSIIIVGGTKDRNNWRIKLGRYPVITWLTTDLQTNIGTHHQHNHIINRLMEFLNCNNTTYSLSMPFKNGNSVSNWSRWVRPCTIATGIKKTIVREVYATKTTSLLIHLLRNETVKKGQ